jgi:hypothetical protein
VLLDTAILIGPFNPVIKLELIAAPVVASYLPIPLSPFATKRESPDKARECGMFTPETKLALIVAPVVASYSPTVLLPLLATYRLLPEIARPNGVLKPEVMKLALIAAPVVASYSPTVFPDRFDTKRELPIIARP